MVHYEDAFPPIFGLTSLILLALAISRGCATLLGPLRVIMTNDPLKQITMTPNAETIKLMLGVSISMMSSLISTAVCANVVLLLPTKSLRKIEYFGAALCLIISLSLLIYGLYTYCAIFTIISIVAATIAKICEARLVFALASLRVACTSLCELPQLATYTMSLLTCYIAWFTLWMVAAYGVASSQQSEVFTAEGVVFDLHDCTSYTYSQTLVIGTHTLTCDTSSTCSACICGDDLIQGDCTAGSMNIYLYLFMGVALLWGTFIAIGVLHCTVASAIAAWWTCHPYETKPLIVRRSFECTVYKSMGAICFGSLVSTLIKTLWLITFCLHSTLHRAVRNKPSRVSSWWNPIVVVVAAVDTLLATLDTWYGYFNRYALCYVAIRQLHFIPASLAILDLFRSRGMLLMLHDAVIDTALFLLQLTSTAIALTTVSFYLRLSAPASSTTIALLYITSIGSSYLLSTLVLRVISAAVSTVFICFADNPAALQRSHPGQYEALQQAWQGLLPHRENTTRGAQEMDEEAQHDPEMLLLKEETKDAPAAPYFCIEYE